MRLDQNRFTGTVTSSRNAARELRISATKETEHRLKLFPGLRAYRGFVARFVRIDKCVQLHVTFDFLVHLPGDFHFRFQGVTYVAVPTFEGKGLENGHVETGPRS